MRFLFKNIKFTKEDVAIYFGCMSVSSLYAYAVFSVFKESFKTIANSNNKNRLN